MNKTPDLFDKRYSKMEKAEMVTNLGKLLNSYQVHLHNLKYFKWNVIGHDHIELTRSFTNVHLKAIEHTDNIASRIRLYSYPITDNWDTILKTSDVKEAPPELSGFEMVKTVAQDTLILISIISGCIEKANEVGDYGTEILTKNLMNELEQEYHLLVCWLR